MSLPDETAIEQIVQAEYVQASEPDYFVSAQATAIDPLINQQWSLRAMNIPVDLPDDLPEVRVAIIDSGICQHFELSGKVLQGYDFVDGDVNPQDEMGHGCAVAGIVAANWDGQGIAGIAPNARLLVYRVLNAQGSGRYSHVASAIVRAVDEGAQIINMSLGGVNSSQLLQDAVNYASSNGVMLIAAAGNNGIDSALYPAAYANVVSVGAFDSEGLRAPFSNYGKVDIWAPGVDVLSLTLADDYNVFSGTSFAAPNVAGLAALELAHGRSLSVGSRARYEGNDEGIVVVPPTAIPTQVPENLTQPSSLVMRNPATVYCEMMGLRTQKVITEEGESIECFLPDGTVCNEWDFYAGICGQEYNYCASEGLQTVTMTDGKDSFSPVYSACADANGTIVGLVSRLSSLGAQVATCLGGACDEDHQPSIDFSAEVGDISALEVPSSFSWQSLMTTVKNQGNCGSCAVFAALGSIEAGYNIAQVVTPNLDLSEQFFVSTCYSPPLGNNSIASESICARGSHSLWFFDYARSGVASPNRICSEGCMPYVAGNWTNNVTYSCNVCSDRHTGGAKIDSYHVGARPLNRQLLKQQIMTYGPGVMSFNIDQYAGYFDSNGIYRCRYVAPQGGHAVIVVGWNNTRGTWIMKNSWGSQWGNNGYFELGYGECNSDDRDYVYFPLINPVSLVNTNLVTNGDFSQGFNDWFTYKQMDLFVNSSILYFKRPTHVSDSAIIKNIPWRVTNGSGLELSFDIGNSSNVVKYFNVSLRSKTSWDNAIQCEFSVPPQTPLRRYVITGSSREWIGMLVEFRVNADGIPDAMLDNVSLIRKTSLDNTPTNCSWALPPANVNLVSNSTFDTPHGWSQSGGLTFNIADGYATFVSKPTSVAGLLMDMFYGLPVNSPVEMTFKIRNTGTESRNIRAAINRQVDWSGSVYCDFTVPPTPTYLTYTMRGRVTDVMAMLRARIDVTDSSTSPAILVDDVFVYYRPALSITTTQCILPSFATPAAPVLTAPTVTLTNNNRPTVAWNSVANATSYIVEFSNNNFASVIHTQTVTTTSYTLAEALPDGTYSIRVRGVNVVGQAGANSAVRSLTVDTIPPNPPVLNLPLMNASVTTFTPTLSWIATGAVGYELQYGLTNPPTQVIGNLTTTSYTFAQPQNVGTLYWQVRARDAAGNWSAWSDIRLFTINNPAGSAPRVIQHNGNTVTLTWLPRAWAQGSQIEIFTNSGLTMRYGQPIEVGAGIWELTTSLPSGTYFWRVRLKMNATTWGAWSPVESIIVR